MNENSSKEKLASRADLIAIVEPTVNDFNSSINVFGKWYAEEEARTESDVPDSLEHLLAGLNAMMLVAQKAAQAAEAQKQAGLVVAGEIYPLQGIELNEEQRKQLTFLEHFEGHHAQARSKFIQVQFDMGARFDLLTARYWSLHPARSAKGPGTVQITKH